MSKIYYIRDKENTPSGLAALLFNGISAEAARAKELGAIYCFSVFIEDKKHKIFGGATGSILYGSLYVDMLWVDELIRHQGWGSQIMLYAEKIAQDKGCSFATVHTMDWEALPFYQNLGYAIEFVREGYQKDSKMIILRKDF